MDGATIELAIDPDHLDEIPADVSARLLPKTLFGERFVSLVPPEDVLWSFLKVLVFAVVIILTHCYYGYRASGGPAGVGLAVGRAVRFSIVAVNIIDLFLSLAIWGSTTTVRIAG